LHIYSFICIIPYEYEIVTPKNSLSLNTNTQEQELSLPSANITRVRVKCARDPLQVTVKNLGCKNFTLETLMNVMNSQQANKEKGESNNNLGLIDVLNRENQWNMHEAVTCMNGVYCLTTDKKQIGQLSCVYNAFEYLDIHGLMENDTSENTCHECHQHGELLLCDGCPYAFHLKCVGLTEFPNVDVQWFCFNCQRQRMPALQQPILTSTNP